MKKIIILFLLGISLGASAQKKAKAENDSSAFTQAKLLIAKEKNARRDSCIKAINADLTKYDCIIRVSEGPAKQVMADDILSVIKRYFTQVEIIANDK